MVKTKPLNHKGSQSNAQSFTGLGGKLTTRARVNKIIVENNTAKGVILSDNTRIDAGYVISAADGHSTEFLVK